MKQKKLYSVHRRTHRQSFYQHRAWRRIRAIQLRRAPLCENCQKQGKLSPANTCDHIDPTWESWEDFIKGPFQSLCPECHKDKTEFEDMPKLRKQDKLKVEVWDD